MSIASQQVDQLKDTETKDTHNISTHQIQAIFCASMLNMY